MSAITVEKYAGRRIAAPQVGLALRIAAGLVPALALTAVWSDFARSVFIGDSVESAIATAADQAAHASGPERQEIAASLASRLNQRGDLRDVSTDVLVNPDRSVSVRVHATVPTVYFNRLIQSYGLERTATTAPRA